MNYQEIALNAAKRLQVENINPINAWDIELKGMSDKGCPRSTFLGLCQIRVVKNVSKGDYTRSKKNLSYAKEGVRILKQFPQKFNSGNELWQEISKSLNLKISHNQQGNVILIYIFQC